MSFEQIGAWAGAAPDVFTVTGEGMPERVSGLRVTHQLLAMLGASPANGRLFRTGDDASRTAQTVVLSHGYWQRRFAGRTDIVGRSLTIENVPHLVIGVLAPGFRLSGSLFAGAPIDMYLPLTVDGDEDIGGFMAVIGRLRPGVTSDRAEAELATRQVALSLGKWNWMTVLTPQVTPLAMIVTREVRAPVLLLFMGIGCLLLLACANLANLLLVRASGRRREWQVRTALGASVGQLLAQTTAESAVLVGLGGTAGIAFAAAALGLLRREITVPIARVGDVEVGWPTLAFAAALCVVMTLIFGGVALVHLRWRDALDALRPHGVTTDPRARYVQRFALATQVALVVVLTVSGGLLVRSLTAIVAVDPGFNPHGAVAIRVDPAGRLEGPARLPFFKQVIERVAASPGVESAAMTIHVPMGDRPSMGWDAIPQGPERNPTADNAAGRIVSPGYFRTAGTQMIEGRDFDWRDVRANPFVMAINETFARRIRAEGGEPLHSRFLVLGNIREVVAVVRDVRHLRLDGEVGREVYIPMAQAPSFFQAYDLIVRGDNPIALVPAIRQAIWDIDRNQALGTPVLLEDFVGRTLGPRRLLTAVIALFALGALLLAAFGVYGVVGYSVGQRAKESAIRIALGAPRWRVTSTMLRDTLTYAGLGLAAGLPLSLAAGDAIRRYLFGVEPDDGVTLTVASIVVITAATVAAWLPARRAPRIDPIAALRIE